MTELTLESFEQLLDQKLDQKFDQKLKPIYQRFDQINRRFDRIDDRFDGVIKRLDRIEDRLDRVETLAETTAEAVTSSPFTHEWKKSVDHRLSVLEHQHKP